MTIRKHVTLSEAEYEAVECALASALSDPEPRCTHHPDGPAGAHRRMSRAALDSALDTIRIASWA